MARTATHPAPRTAGFTLVELLVAMALLLAVLTIAFNIFSSSNNLVETDTGRIMAQQNAQTALDVMAADVRQAGENLDVTADLGISGLEFDDSTDRVIVRRSVSDLPGGVKLARLPVCAVAGTALQVVGPVPGSSTATPRCAFSDGDGDGEADNVMPWRTYFTSQGDVPQAALLYRPAAGSVPALLANTTVRRVEPLVTSSVGGVPVQRVSVTLGTPVPVDFTAANNSVLILVDERRYQLVGTELRLAQGGQTDAEAQPLAFGVTDLSVSALLGTATTPVSSMTLNSAFAQIRSVSLGLSAQNAGQGKRTTRTFQATIFPRNVETARTTPGAP